jgi:carboxymethylenebutenolidase
MLHPWWGLSDGAIQICDQLAAQGFVVVAPDLYGGRRARTIPEAEALAELRRHPAVRGEAFGAVGMSMGVWFALKLATLDPDLRAVALYYGTADDIDHSAHRAAVLGHFAEADSFEPAAGVSSLEEQIWEAGHAVTFHVYPGVGHWFAEADRPDAYDPDAAALSLERTAAFLSGQLA